MAEMNAVHLEGTGFFPIRVTSLRAEAVAEFDLYLFRGDGQPVLYRGKRIPFTQQSRCRLLEKGILRLYVEKAQEGEYRQYIEENLTALLTDPAVEPSVKSETLYYSATKLMEDVMADPRSGDLLPRSRGFVENTCRFLREEKGALRHLMRVSSHDYYTYTHSVNVMVFSVALAERAGMSDPAKLKQFGQGALLHDLGKSQLDPAIVNCAGKLDDAQWAEMKKHPEHGWTILREQGVLDAGTLGVVRHHHEKLTGKGYPDGLEADAIPTLTRVTTIADVFDALTTKRSYKASMDSFAALSLMRNQMAPDLDADLFRLFVEMLGNPG